MNYPRQLLEAVDALIGFRVECHDKSCRAASQHFINLSSIRSRGYISDDDFWQAAENHLSWKPVRTPFVSFFRSWERALKWREHLIERKGKGIMIVAVWLKDLSGVYNAYNIAQCLIDHQGPSSSSGLRRNLAYFRGELLVQGGIDYTEYRILACFRATTLRSKDDPYRHCSKVPRGVLLCLFPEELYRYTASQI